MISTLDLLSRNDSIEYGQNTDPDGCSIYDPFLHFLHTFFTTFFTGLKADGSRAGGLSSLSSRTLPAQLEKPRRAQRGEFLREGV